MSNKTQLQTNNMKLDALIETLRGKASGSGGGTSVETCEIEIHTFSEIDALIYVTIENDQVVTKTIENSTNSSLTIHPIKGSALSIVFRSAMPTFDNEAECITYIYTLYSSFQEDILIEVYNVNGSGTIK